MHARLCINSLNSLHLLTAVAVASNVNCISRALLRMCTVDCNLVNMYHVRAQGVKVHDKCTLLLLLLSLLFCQDKHKHASYV